jgi:hypothetical protein
VIWEEEYEGLVNAGNAPDPKWTTRPQKRRLTALRLADRILEPEPNQFRTHGKTRVVIDPRTVDQTPLGEDPWRREDFEEEEDDQEEAAEQVEAKSEDFGEDKEWTTEVTSQTSKPKPRPEKKTNKPSPKSKP